VGGSWTEKKVVHEVRGLLSAVGRLHDSGAVHRDITPFNVLTCGPKHTLKLVISVSPDTASVPRGSPRAPSPVVR